MRLGEAHVHGLAARGFGYFLYRNEMLHTIMAVAISGIDETVCVRADLDLCCSHMTLATISNDLVYFFV